MTRPPSEAHIEATLGKLSEKEKLAILEPQTPFLTVRKCCTDPEWIYYAYQDSFVDCAAVIELLRAAPNIDPSSVEV